jgi:transposase
MSKTTKSSIKVAKVALRVAARTLPKYAHQFSPKKFTQPQLFACLVLKTLWKCDFRTAQFRLEESDKIVQTLGLKTVPHFSTMHKASLRLLSQQNINQMLKEIIKTVIGQQAIIDIAALDATGLQSGHISPHYYNIRVKALKKRKWSRFTRWPKMAAIVDTTNHIILAIHPTRGPGRDASHFKDILGLLPDNIDIRHLLADAGYDSEANHIFSREQKGIKTTIPATIGIKTDRPPRGKYRREMKEHFDKENYGQRWQVETVFSMIKRNLGYALAGRSQQTQNNQMLLMAITHNLMIFLLIVKELFYRARIRD